MSLARRLISTLFALCLIRLRTMAGAGRWDDLRILFDRKYYLERYPDVAAGIWPPKLHFLLWGGVENRDPHPFFDTHYYLANNPDVRTSGVNPLVHYVLYGGKERRNPHPRFDTERYLQKHPAALAASFTPLAHYWKYNRPNVFCPDCWAGDRTTILYLIPSFHIGGAESFDLRIMSCLPRDRFSIIVVACEQPDGPWRNAFEARASAIYSLELMGRDQDTRMAFLRNLMIAKSVDVVFNRNTFAGYELCDSWRATTTTVRYVDLLHLHAFGEDWVRASAPYHSKLDLRYVTSRDLPEYAARQYHLDPASFRMLDYGLEPEEIPDAATKAARRASLRRQWNIRDSALVVGFIGRLTEQKDPYRWLSVAARIADLDAEAMFLVVGGGEMLPATRAAAERPLNGKIVFTDYQPSSDHYCAAIDVLLMTSKYEGLPVTVLNALACGTPVVSTDVGGIRWAVSDETGRTLSPHDTDDAYAAAVIDIGRRRRADGALDARCREQVASRYTIERMRARLESDMARLTGSLDRAQRLKDYQLDLMSRAVIG